MTARAPYIGYVLPIPLGYVAIRFPIGADVFCKSVLTTPQL